MYILTIGNINARRYPTPGERQNIQAGEIWPQECVLLQISAPGQQLDEVLGALDEAAKLL